jgi:pyruvate dehydrogenase E1 component beta subunit
MLYGEKGPVPEDSEFTRPFGHANVLRTGSDVTIIGVNIMVKKALEAAELLAKEGISVEVIDPCTLVPLDNETLIRSVAKTSRVVIAHEAHRRAGPAAEIAAVLAEEAIEYLDGPIIRVGAKNVPLPYSPILENYVLPGTNEIVEAVRMLV